MKAMIGGKEKTLVLHDCKCIPDFGLHNLCSITHCLGEGYELENEGRNVTLRKGKFKLVFDKIVKTLRGCVCGMGVEPTNE